MFQIFITNWAKDYNVGTGKYTLITAETPALSIPYSGLARIWLDNPNVKAEVNKAESFDFSLTPGTEYFNAFLPYKTWIRVVYDTTTIFWGRVKTINDSTILQKRSVHAEGIYSILNESPVEGVEEDLQVSVNMSSYLHSLIDNHNSYIEEDIKKFSIGNINVQLDGETKKRGPTSWSTTVSEMDKLIDETGGYVRTRYNDNYGRNGDNRTYIDWTKYYFRDLGDNKRPTIKLARNLIDISKGIENNDIFTRVIPFGSKSTTADSKESRFVYLPGRKYLKVSEFPSYGTVSTDEFHRDIDYVNAEKNYGVIYKTVSFANADTVDKLREYAADWIKNNYFGIIHNFSVKAIDMHVLGEIEPQILVGDCIDVTYPEFDNDGTKHEIRRKLIVKAIQYDLFHPENNVYTVGVPCDATDFEYGSKNKKKASKSSAEDAGAKNNVSGGGGGSSTTISWTSIRNWLRYYYYSIDHKDVVPWTETRWTTFKEATVVRKEDGETITVTDLIPDVIKSDLEPYNTFDRNGKFLLSKTVNKGTDEEGKDIIEQEKRYVYITVTRPGGSSTVKAKVMGHYNLSSDTTKFKPGTTPRPGFNYGVCVSTDGHVYTFSWNSFYSSFYAYVHNTHLSETDITLEGITFSTYFEIAKAKAGGGLDEDTATEAATNGNASIGKMIGDTIWQGAERVINGFLTRVETIKLAAEKGIINVGYDVDEETGEVTPIVVLNDTITYTDKDGRERTISGAITAKDLALPSIPSFETEIAVIHELIADRITTQELNTYQLRVGGQFDEVEQRLAAQGVSITDIDSRVVTIGSDLTDAEGKLVEQGKSITKLGSDVTAIRSDLTDTELELARQGTSITKIGSDVTVIGGNLTDAQAEIARNGQSITAINTDITDINSDLVNIKGQLTASAIKSKIADITAIEVQSGTVDYTWRVTGATFADGGLWVKNGIYQAPGNAQYNVLDASVDGNTLTITRVDGGSVTFNKATSLSGAWSSAVYTVTAKQNSITVNTNSTRLASIEENGTITAVDNFPKLLSVPLKVMYVGANEQPVSTGLEVTKQFNATPVWEKGRNAATVTMDDYTYDARTGGLNDHRTITAHAHNTNNSSNKGSKDLTLYITNGSTANTAYLRAGSTSGTALASVTHYAYSNGRSNVTVSSFTGTDIGGSDESNSNPITANLSNGKSGSSVIYMGIGSWNSGKIGVTTRIGDSNGTCINRVFVSAPGVTGLRAVKNGIQQIIYGKVGGSSEKALGTISIPS